MSERRQDETDGADRTAPPDDAAADRADESTEGRRGSHGDDPGDGRSRDGRESLRAEESRQFTSVSTAFYRGQVDRVTTWRTRLDQTTNWAVVVMAAILTWAFTSPDNPHYVLLIGGLAALVFLGIEAQRYQEYDAWRTRVRVLEATYFADGYDSDDAGDGRWRDWLGGDLREPALQMTLLEAAGHRLLHIYVHLLTVLLAAWGLRIAVYKTSETWRETASIATVPGEAVVAGVLLVYLGLLAVTAWSAHRGLRREFDPERAAERLPDERR
jgi:uncharacterized membrane protein